MLNQNMFMPLKVSVRVLLFASAQGLSMTSVNITVITSFLAAIILMDNPAFASVPYGLQYLGATIFSFPTVMVMKHIGRKYAFIIGQMIGTLAGLICAFGLYEGSFLIFCIGSFIIGIHGSFWQYIRFAVTEEVDEKYKNKALSWVLVGGLLAAFLGEYLAIAGREMFETIFMGSYILLAAVTFCNIFVFIIIPFHKKEVQTANKKPYKLSQALGYIVSHKLMLLAVISASFAYITMVLVMTCSPFAMQEHAHHFEHITSAIKWHVIAMFAPSLFTGSLIEKFGLGRILFIGVLFNIMAVIAHLSDVSYAAHVSGLIFLGLGWNFLFVGGSTLLVRTQEQENYLQIQGANDTIIQISNAISAFASGLLITLLGWEILNIIILIPLAVILLFLFLNRHSDLL